MRFPPEIREKPDEKTRLHQPKIQEKANYRADFVSKSELP
jgi:hypothetical protein